MRTVHFPLDAGETSFVVGDSTVTATGGSTPHTLSDWFAGIGKEDIPASLGMYTDVPPGANITRFRDKVLIGDGVNAWDGYVYEEGVTTGSKIMDHDIASRYLEKGASFVCISDIGTTAGLFASFTSDNGGESTDPSSIAVAAVGWCDFEGPPGIPQTAADFPSSWGAYIEAHRNQGCGPGLIEFELANHGDEAAILTSYGVRGTNINRALCYMAIGSGAASAVTVHDATAFLVFTGNGARARSGLVFINGSLTGQTGDGTGAGRAIELARDMEIVQTYAATVNARGGTIRFQGSNHATAAREVFDTGAWRIQGPESDGTTYDNIFSVLVPNLTAGQTLNGLVVQPQLAGTNHVVFGPAGADADIAVSIVGKGVAGVRLCDASLNARVNANATGLGFFGATPIAQPTGVAVSTAGIHAALVSLGLITA